VLPCFCFVNAAIDEEVAYGIPDDGCEAEDEDPNEEKVWERKGAREDATDAEENGACVGDEEEEVEAAADAETRLHIDLTLGAGT
jgi:hypothetical protein